MGLNYTTVTIADAAALSSASKDLGPLGVPIAIILPSTWTAQKLTFQVSPDDGANYYNLFDAGTEYETASAAASALHLINKEKFRHFNKIKIRSGTSGTPANQAGGDVLTIVCDPNG